MSRKYAIKGSNTLYKVWGIITFAFAGIYALARLIVFIAVIKASSEIGQYTQYSYWLGFGNKYDEIKKYFILGMIIFVLVFLVGLAVRIFAGMFLIQPYVGSKGGMITAAAFYFLIALLNIVSVVTFIKLEVISLVLFYLFCTAWAVATGILLIMKQAAAVPWGYNDYIPNSGGVDQHMANGPIYGGQQGGYDAYNPPDFQETIAYAPQDPNGGHGMTAEIQGLFGDYVGKKYTLRPGESCRIGRDSGCDIQLHSSKVSRIHCSVKLLPKGKFELTDYSYNGTYYENKTLPNGTSTIVEPGGLLAVGNADNVFSLTIL